MRRACAIALPPLMRRAAALAAAAAEAAKHTPVVHSESNAGFRVLVLLQQSEQRKQENEHW